MRGVFVTGTGTGIGKSVVAAALLAALREQGREVLASKPLLSGLDEAPAAPWPHDHDLLALVSGAPADVIAPRRFGPAVSPHLASRLEGMTIRVDELVADVQRRHDEQLAAFDARPTAGSLVDRAPIVVVEGAGGLLVPIDDDDATMATLAFDLGLPILIVAPPGLGTINHVQLTLEAATTRTIPVAGIVLTPWPAEPSEIERDNRAFLEAHSDVPVRALDPVAGPEPHLLAAAGHAAGLHRLV